MEFIRNNKGGLKLCYDGYMYTKKSSNKSKTRWECTNREALACRGAISTDLANTEVVSSIPHTHERVTGRVEAVSAVSAMKENIPMNRGCPGKILADTLHACSTEARAAMGNTDSLKRKIRCLKHKNRPKEPTSLRDLQLTQDWTTTDKTVPLPFLIHDSGNDSPCRMLVFATEIGLRHLCRSDTWYMDGTFSSAPRIFEQLYVIPAPLGETAVTCVYAFLTSKSQETYEELFGAVVRKCEDLGFSPNPSKVICDFEQSVIRAIGTTFGDQVRCQGCFYHLT